MKQSSTLQADSSSGNHGIPSILRNMKFHYGVHKRSTAVPIRTHLNPDKHLLTNFFQIYFNIILPFTHRSPKLSLPLSFLKLLSYFFQIYFNIILPFTHRSPKLSLPLNFPNLLTYFFQIYFNIILPPTHRSPKSSLPLRFLIQVLY